jgi:hypothetical protein
VHDETRAPVQVEPLILAVIQKMTESLNHDSEQDVCRCQKTRTACRRSEQVHHGGHGYAWVSIILKVLLQQWAIYEPYSSAIFLQVGSHLAALHGYQGIE